MASHSGTHLDAPLHKLSDGKSIDQYPLEAFTGKAWVADLEESVSPDYPIRGTDLETALNGVALSEGIVLLNTGWGHKRAKTEEWLFHSPYLAPDGAEWLASRGVKGVGIDHFSIGGTRDPDNSRTHEILLGAGLWVVEELCFRSGWKEAVENAYFQALPLRLENFSGSPCRAVLIRP